ncbi:hypothetical protein FHW58_005072 [Duganella sp. 1224]|uniref:hypothetical protein n=1 Tax=Duganella sp. 1224 TaxID=2587052 RepID=UPI0015C78B2C|nr:hypothetical protein [Duganella sp. 1224]NYE63838.1 hypothetical protein [Duganella sp. 1224]
MIRSVFAALVLTLMAFGCRAAESCPPSSRQEAWDAACFAGSGAQRHVKPQHLRQLGFGKSGYALIMVDEPPELVAVDWRGVVVVPGIYHDGEGDYPQPRGHLARFRDGARCGYFDVRTFQVRVPASYDQCLAFGEQTAQACKDCQVYCTESECQNSMLVGGRGVEIDQRGRIARQFRPPPLAQACAGGQQGTLESRGGRRFWLRCPPAPPPSLQMENVHGR